MLFFFFYPFRIAVRCVRVVALEVGIIFAIAPTSAYDSTSQHFSDDPERKAVAAIISERKIIITRPRALATRRLILVILYYM